MYKKYRIVNPVRFTIFLVVLILVTATVLTSIMGYNKAQSMSPTQYMDLEVQPGDTLWNIAETYMTDVPDVREAVYQLCILNDIKAQDLVAGMTIQVPVA